MFSHVGGVLVAPRLFTCTELRDKRATYKNPATVHTCFHPLLPERATLNDASEWQTREELLLYSPPPQYPNHQS